MKDLSTATVLSLTNFVGEMHDKLEEKQQVYGDDWREKSSDVDDRLRRMLDRNRRLGKWVNVANLAMMLRAREQARK